MCLADSDFSYLIDVQRPGFRATPEILKYLDSELEEARKTIRTGEMSRTIYTLDNHQPRDLSILVTPRKNKTASPIMYGYPPRSNDGFTKWVMSRIEDGSEKGAQMVMMNYLFWLEAGEQETSLRDLIQRWLNGVALANNRLSLEVSGNRTVGEVVVFTPSGDFEIISICREC
jgi:hypothetical protein